MNKKRHKEKRTRPALVVDSDRLGLLVGAVVATVTLGLTLWRGVSVVEAAFRVSVAFVCAYAAAAALVQILRWVYCQELRAARARVRVLKIAERNREMQERLARMAGGQPSDLSEESGEA